MKTFRLFLLGLFLFPQPAGAWDSTSANFPTTDVPFMQLRPASPEPPDDSILGYFPVAAVALNIAPYPTTITTGYPNGGKLAATRATLALMQDAVSTEPILFPDWAPSGTWAPGGFIWDSAGGDIPYLQRLYNTLSHLDPTTIMTDADRAANKFGSVVVTHTLSSAGPITVPNSDCYRQGILTYSIYGNAVQPFIPTTLADEGPIPVKDERAWPLPYDQCP
jgi:hypothetical protein